MRELDSEAKEAGITVLNEVGVDPGVDHLYAVKTIDEVHEKGGKVFASIISKLLQTSRTFLTTSRFWSSTRIVADSLPPKLQTTLYGSRYCLLVLNLPIRSSTDV